ncbi:MAG: hypothetical protein JRI23_03745 [Deltaproteobacteria bacterium]|jgi:hypothetical protein|nr:hypothetical protein [Deltaproteobacteria bacterium]MBW2530632.1 hypothetical protein [Deltaproteobacteria bacterium]
MSESNDEPRVESFRLRASYPNTYSRFIEWQRFRGPLPGGPPPGYVPPVAEYLPSDRDEWQTIEVRGSDLTVLNDADREVGNRHLERILSARRGSDRAGTELARMAAEAEHQAACFCQRIALQENEFVVPSYTANSYDAEHVSHKGANLLRLSQLGHPVPDFCILTCKTHSLEAAVRRRHVAEAIGNLENMTGRVLGSPERPLVMAMRYAMPEYIPGLMPTYLNVGITEAAYPALCNIYGPEAASKMYLNNLRNMDALLDPHSVAVAPDEFAAMGSQRERDDAIDRVLTKIRTADAKLLEDAFYQIKFFVGQARRFFEANEELLFTFTKQKGFRPSLILQQMICTVRDDQSYPGVLYSRSPRAGRAMRVESVPCTFGEEFMTGTVPTEVDEFMDPEQIRERLPAVFHYLPTLPVLERAYGCSLTVEFAAESVRRAAVFAVLQVNESEMTGRAALISTMDMAREGIIGPGRVPDLIKPYHLRQISSPSIADKEIAKLTFFSQGFAILPRGAVVARAYFTAAAALSAKRSRGQAVCFCKPRFVPSDTMVMSEVDAIVGLTPAAIHVVTACRGYGIPGFLDLESYGVTLEEPSRLVNAEGVSIEEGEWITVSSKRGAVFKGQASFVPPRFERYLQGEEVPLEADEPQIFEALKEAYLEYQQLIHGLQAEQIESLDELIKVIRTDLRDDPEHAAEIVNRFFDRYTDYYVEAVLDAQLGTHLEQFDVYRKLTTERQVELHERAVARCLSCGLTGLTAGSFMIGRFISTAHPIAFWERLDEREVAFMLNEWILFMHYLKVLDDVGERRINKAREVILEKRTGAIRLTAGDAKVFMTLKLSHRDLDRVVALLPEESAAETGELLAMLREPYGYFYDYETRWSVGELKRLCEQAGIPQPAADER